MAVTKFLVTVFQFADPVINHQSVFLTNGVSPPLTGAASMPALKKQASLLASSYVRARSWTTHWRIRAGCGSQLGVGVGVLLGGGVVAWWWQVRS